MISRVVKSMCWEVAAEVEEEYRVGAEVEGDEAPLAIEANGEDGSNSKGRTSLGKSEVESHREDAEDEEIERRKATHQI